MLTNKIQKLLKITNQIQKQNQLFKFPKYNCSNQNNSKETQVAEAQARGVELQFSKQEVKLNEILEQYPSDLEIKAKLATSLCLKKEFVYEMGEIDLQALQSSVNAVQQQGFKIIEEQGTKEFRLIKQIGDYEIEIVFFLIERQLDKDLYKMKWNLDELDEGEKHVQIEQDQFGITHHKSLKKQMLRNFALDKENPMGIKEYQKKPFNIYIRNVNEEQEIKYLGIMDGGDIIIHRVSIENQEDEKPPVLKQLDGKYVKYESYIPKFYNLSDNLQFALMGLIESFDISGELFYHIEMIQVNLIQKKYMQWLQTLHTHYTNVENVDREN